MSTRSARSALFEAKPASKRLAAASRAWPCTRMSTVLTSAALTAALCITLAACSNDDGSKTPDTSTTSAEQINAAPPAPYAVPQTSSAQPAQSAQAILPAQTIQTPPPTSAQVGAAASDSLVTPVIHTVD
ncbi:hypothetical protein SAMN05216466_11678 [Paraburkholderia phenazinium]|uniref:Uncharacterized protein n=1 Tax=Paraburkholderia phenazinium TaxID=60549 RepID=A0A1G8HB20_9BURK|nr:hypothetical protein SAMN05216466_11678 [Paraburkholderia phenazinium]